LRSALRLLPIVLGLGSSTAVAQTGETNWSLLRGRDIASLPSEIPQLTIKGQALSGSTGCNTFTTTLVQQSEGKVSIERPRLTRKLCGPQQQNVENAFVDALGQTQFMEEKDNQLTFLSATREPLLVWQPLRAPGQTRSLGVKLGDNRRPLAHAQMHSPGRHMAAPRKRVAMTGKHAGMRHKHAGMRHKHAGMTHKRVGVAPKHARKTTMARRSVKRGCRFFY